MKKEKIKALPVVKAFEAYFKRKAKRALGFKKDSFDSFHIEYSNTTRTVRVWFFMKCNVIGNVMFNADGKRVTDRL